MRLFRRVSALCLALIARTTSAVACGRSSEASTLPASPSTSFLLWEELHFSLVLSDIPSPALC